MPGDNTSLTQGEDWGITLPATIENTQGVQDFLEQALRRMNCPGRERTRILIAAEEIFVNIARYAYAPATGEAAVRLEHLQNPKGARITFEDRGIAFNPLSMAEPAPLHSVEEAPIGGLGILLVKRTMDDVSYCYETGRNILRITKFFGNEA